MLRFLTLALAITISLSSFNTALTNAQDKLPVTLKAKLADYKGPSRFGARRALITFSPDGKLVVTSGKERTVTIWDARTGALKATLKGGKEGINGFAFSPDGKLAATRDLLDKTVRLWDVETWEMKAMLTGRKRDLETKLKVNLPPILEEGYAPINFSPDGRTVVSEREDDIVDIWDVTTGQNKLTLNHDSKGSATKEFLKGLFSRGTQHYLVMQTDYSPDGRYLVTVNGDKSPKIWDAATGDLKTTLAVTERIYRASFSPDGRTLATMELQGVVTLWDVATGQPQATLTKKREEYEFPGFAFSPDGQTAVTFDFEETKLWDVESGQLRFALPRSKANDAAFSPDGRWLATASDYSQYTARIWDVETGEVKTTMPPIKDRAQFLLFSPDGKILVTTNDKGVKLWDTTTGELLASLDEARYPVAFSPDGKTLATGGRKDTAMLWEIPAR